MKKIIIASVFIFLASGTVDAQKLAESQLFSEGVPESKIRELGIPDPVRMMERKEKAHAAFEAGDCGKAIPELDSLARETDWYGTLILTGLEPYFQADIRDRRDFADQRLLMPLEKKGNEYLVIRNEAMVMLAECLSETGDTDAAVSAYIRALKAIYINERELWERARNGLYELIGFSL